MARKKKKTKISADDRAQAKSEVIIQDALSRICSIIPIILSRACASLTYDSANAAEMALKKKVDYREFDGLLYEAIETLGGAFSRIKAIEEGASNLYHKHDHGSGIEPDKLKDFADTLEKKYIKEH